MRNPHLVLPLPSSGQTTGHQSSTKLLTDLHWQIATAVIFGALGTQQKDCVKNMT